jgi:uncharacterized protein YkwD
VAVVLFLLLATQAGCQQKEPERAVRRETPDTFLAGETDRTFLAVNNERVRCGVPPLARDRGLDQVASQHARDLAKMNTLSHTGQRGQGLEKRLEHLEWVWAAENLARNKGFEDSGAEAVRGWLASPRHAENMLRTDFTTSGMAVLRDGESGFVYFVQVFIVPMS